MSYPRQADGTERITLKQPLAGVCLPGVGHTWDESSDALQPTEVVAGPGLQSDKSGHGL